VFDYLQVLPEFRSVYWIDASRKLQWSFPSAHAQMITPTEVVSQEFLLKTLQNARADQSTSLSAILQMRDGNQGVLVCVPVRNQSRFSGWIVGLVDLNVLLEMLRRDSPGHRFELQQLPDNPQDDVAKPRPDEHSHDTELLVRSGRWHLRLTREAGMLKNPGYALAMVVLFTGLSLALLLAWIVYLGHLSFHRAAQLAQEVEQRKRTEAALQVHQDHLEELVRERTESLDRTIDQLAAANKELEAFTYSVSHDLRAPLRGIDGFSRVLLQEYAVRLDDEGHRLLDKVRQNAQKMGELIDDLLAFSRMGRCEIGFARVNMTALARQAADEARTAANPNRTIEISVGDMPAAWGDPPMLLQVWRNLLSNAVKYTRPRSAARIDVGGRQEGDQALYWVRDNGVGFDMQFAGKLFGVFQRLHRLEEFEGTGVGLAIVQRVIFRHRGRVWAESQPDEGACFYFTVPNQASAMAGSPDNPSEEADGRSSRGHLARRG
jgi:signal transduction histidine kinase